MYAMGVLFWGLNLKNAIKTCWWYADCMVCKKIR
jgi:hypothetical protein